MCGSCLENMLNVTHHSIKRAYEKTEAAELQNMGHILHLVRAEDVTTYIPHEVKTDIYNKEVVSLYKNL